MEKKLNITSTAIEKGIDAATGFLNKLIMPAVEESGLLIKDQVTRWRFNNQIKMLNKAKAYCEKHNVSVKQVSFKLLCPLLDYAGMEENEKLQEHWAILLGNLVDSEQNIENHVFPYILSQISVNEFEVTEKVYSDRQIRVRQLKSELAEFRSQNGDRLQAIRDRVDAHQNELRKMRDAGIKPYSQEYSAVKSKKDADEKEIWPLTYKERNLLNAIERLEEYGSDELKNYEFSNLIRLGIVKEVSEIQNDSANTLEIPNLHPDHDEYKSHTEVDLDINMSLSTEIVLTELGELFMRACKEKTTVN